MTPDWLASAERVVVLDLETTGLDPQSDSILEVAAIRLDRGKEVGRFETLVNPGSGVAISACSYAVHGIDAAMVAGAPETAWVIGALQEFVKNDPIAAHHAPFDVAFLGRAASQTGHPPFQGPVIDTLDAAKVLFPEQRSHKLEALCQLLGHPGSQFHRAGLDAAHLAAIFPALQERWRAYRAWQEAQFYCIERVAQRYEDATRLQESLQLEMAQLRRTLTRYLEHHPGARLSLRDGTSLVLHVRERWEYDVDALMPLLDAWDLRERALKLDRQRLERWLADGRLSEAQQRALMATRVPQPSTGRLVRQPRAGVDTEVEGSCSAGEEP